MSLRSEKDPGLQALGTKKKIPQVISLSLSLSLSVSVSLWSDTSTQMEACQALVGELGTEYEMKSKCLGKETQFALVELQI
jgi:hypothetical protein